MLSFCTGCVEHMSSILLSFTGLYKKATSCNLGPPLSKLSCSVIIKTIAHTFENMKPPRHPGAVKLNTFYKLLELLFTSKFIAAHNLMCSCIQCFNTAVSSHAIN